MRVVPIPCLADNYAYLVICEETREAAIVDPSEAAPVRAAVTEAGVKLRAIWNTHHHWDHTGGNTELASDPGGLEVVGHASDEKRVPALTRGVNDGDRVKVGQLEARILHIPGHTTGAIAFVVEDAVFTGDTMFLAGCGRLFEGTPEMMYRSLGKLAELPKQTRVFPGHEYTRSNLKFAEHAEPGNTDIKTLADQLGAADGPTVPGTIAGEMATNPFVRAESVERLAALRKEKDSF